MITVQQLSLIMPGAKDRCFRYIEPLNDTMAEFEINTALRQASFLAQIAHESGQLLYVRELASGVAYEGRKDLGNTQEGDGRKFRGHGLLQVTGRDNSAKCAQYFGKSLDKWLEWVITTEGAARSSGWWWMENHMNRIADTGDEVQISKAVNCGNPMSHTTPRGLKERLAFKAAALKILTTDQGESA